MQRYDGLNLPVPVNSGGDASRGFSQYRYRPDGHAASLQHAMRMDGAVIANYSTVLDDALRTTSVTRSLLQSVYTSTFVEDETKTIFDYDGLGQVISAETRTKTNTLRNTNAYGHDSLGTTDEMRVLGQDTIATVGLDYRVSEEAIYQNRKQVGTRFYRYDNEGRVLERALYWRAARTTTERELFTWDHRGRLTRLEPKELNGDNQWVVVSKVEYFYDALDRRIGRVARVYDKQSGEIQRYENVFFVYDVTGLAMEVSVGNSDRVGRHYLRGPAQAGTLAIDQSGAPATNTVWLFPDMAGSAGTVAYLDPAGGSQPWKLYHRVFDEYGNITATGGEESLPLKAVPTFWRGLRFEEIGSIFLVGVTAVSPQTGRYLSQAAPGDSNRYRFAVNQPTKPEEPETKLYREIGHRVLDAIGVVDPTGIADTANASWYASEGRYWEASISMAGALLPYAGDALKLGRGTVKAVVTAEEAAEAAVAATKASSAARLGRASVNAGVGGATGTVLGGTIGFGAGYYSTGTWEGAWAGAWQGAESGLLHGAIGGFTNGFYLRGAPTPGSIRDRLSDAGNASRGRSSELIRQTSGANVGPFVDPAKVNRILANLNKQGVQVIRGEKAAMVLDDIGAAAAYHPMFGMPHLFFRDGGITRGQLVEELLHHGQHLRRGFARPGSFLEAKRMTLLDEIAAQRYMIDHATRRGWTQAEIDFYKSQLNRWDDDYTAFQLEHGS